LKKRIQKKTSQSKSKQPTQEESLKKQIRSLEKEINGIIDLVQQVEHKRALLSRLDALEEERLTIKSQLQSVDSTSVSKVMDVKPADISRFLKKYKETFQCVNIERKKSMLMSCISTATLDGNRLTISPSYESITGIQIPVKNTVIQVRKHDS